MGETNIEWADRVWNPVTGCTKVSQGCKNCYAETIAERFWKTQYPYVPVNALPDHTRAGIEASAGAALANIIERAPGARPRRFTDVQTHDDRLLEPLKWRKPSRIFVNSMSDLFHEDVSDEFIGRVFDVMASAPRHTFLILTKRPERMASLLTSFTARHTAADGSGWPLPNVHLGVSVENQQTADERIPLLLQTPAAIRWVSYEPALGPIDFEKYLDVEGPEVECCGEEGCEYCDGTGEAATYAGLNWIVVGGESGPGARPFDLVWARSTVDQGAIADVPVFVKQLGPCPHVGDAGAGYAGDFFSGGGRHWRMDDPTGEPLHVYEIRDRKGGDMSEWPEDLRVRELPEVHA